MGLNSLDGAEAWARHLGHKVVLSFEIPKYKQPGKTTRYNYTVKDEAACMALLEKDYHAFEVTLPD